MRRKSLAGKKKTIWERGGGGEVVVELVKRIGNFEGWVEGGSGEERREGTESGGRGRGK